MIIRQAERPVFWLVPSRANAEDKPAVADLVDCCRHLCQDGRVAEGVARYQRADLDPLCRFCQCRQHGPALPDSPGRLTRITIEEMVRKPDTIETVRLSLLRDCTDRIIRTLVVVFAFVREKDHQPNLHCFVTRRSPPIPAQELWALHRASGRPAYGVANSEWLH